MVKMLYKGIVIYKSTRNEEREIYKQIFKTAIDIGKILDVEPALTEPSYYTTPNLQKINIVGYKNVLKVIEKSNNIRRAYDIIKDENLIEELEEIYIEGIHATYRLGYGTYIADEFYVPDYRERLFLIGDNSWGVYQHPRRKSAFRRVFFKPERIDVGLFSDEIEESVANKLLDLGKMEYNVNLFKFR